MRVLRQLLKIACETAYIRIVKCRLDLIKKTEWRRLQILDCKQKCDCSKCLLTTGKLHHILKLFAWRLGNNTNSCFQNVHVFLKLQSALTASKQFLESLVKLSLDILEFLRKLFTHSLIQFLDNVLQLCLCGFQILILSGKESMTL